MRVLVIGATGTIGRAVVEALEGRHDVLRAARRGPLRVDMEDGESVSALLAETGELDAVVCCAASGALTPLDAPSSTEYWRGMKGKLIGQVELVRRALPHLRNGGSITLSSGRFTGPVTGSTLGHLVNAGLEAFVRAAAHEVPPHLRLNVVSPGWVRETLVSLGMDPAEGTPVGDVARRYVEAVESDLHGQVLAVGATGPDDDRTATIARVE